MQVSTAKIVKTVEELVNKGWKFEEVDGQVTMALNPTLKQAEFFENPKELKEWIGKQGRAKTAERIAEMTAK